MAFARMTPLLPTYIRMTIWRCTTLKPLPQIRIVPKLSPDQFWTASDNCGTYTSQIQHGTKNRTQFQHWAGANMRANIYILITQTPSEILSYGFQVKNYYREVHYKKGNILWLFCHINIKDLYYDCGEVAVMEQIKSTMHSSQFTNCNFVSSFGGKIV
jgi:hypothetical protein